MSLSEREALLINVEDRALEKAGRINDAVALYEYALRPAPYKRLRIL